MMEVCMTYYKENEIEAIYLFGIPKNSSKGIKRCTEGRLAFFYYVFRKGRRT